MSQTISKSYAENEMTRGDDAAIWSDDLDGLEVAYTGFSCPFEPFDESFAQLISGEYARSVLDLFVKQFSGALTQTGGGLDALFSRLLVADLPLELTWSSALGNLYGATRLQDPEHACREAATFALMAGTQGISNEWKLGLSKPAVFFWGDWVLPECDELRVASDNAGARIELALGSERTQITFTRHAEGSGWECDTPGRTVRLPTFGSGTRQLVLLPRSAALSAGFFGDDEDAANALEDFSPEVMETLTRALELLKRHVPPYFEWVMRIIKRVTILHSEQNLLRSGSHQNQHGTIHISNNLRVLFVAEMLVHEASHQYLELLRKLGPTVDPTHDKLYYSPVKRCDRPLHKILLAYHAFANVMLFYRGVTERGLTDELFENQRNVLTDELRQLEQPLIGVDAITPIGRALVDPLIERRVSQ